MGFDRYTRDTSKLYDITEGSTSDELGGLIKRSSIPGYHGTAYGGIINQKLRKGEQLFSNEIGVVTTLDSKMELTKSPMELDREVNDGYFREVGLDFENITDLVGKTFQDKGFVSTTYRPNLDKTSQYSIYGGTPIFLDIRVPQGIPAMLTDNNEYEITLGRGLIYRISSVRVDVDKKPLLMVDIIKM